MSRAEPRAKKCRVCPRYFTPMRSTQKVCGPACAMALVGMDRAKKAAREAREERKANREARERVKTRGTHLRELQAAFNAWVRARDAGQPCISCGRPAEWEGQWHASHFRSVGSTPELRFNPLNVHKACSVCNNFLSGNIGAYRPRLIEKIGLEQVEWIEGMHVPQKLTIPKIIEMKAHYRAEVRRLRKEQT